MDSNQRNTKNLDILVTMKKHSSISPSPNHSRFLETEFLSVALSRRQVRWFVETRQLKRRLCAIESHHLCRCALVAARESSAAAETESGVTMRREHRASLASSTSPESTAAAGHLAQHNNNNNISQPKCAGWLVGWLRGWLARSLSASSTTHSNLRPNKAKASRSHHFLCIAFFYPDASLLNNTTARLPLSEWVSGRIWMRASERRALIHSGCCVQIKFAKWKRFHYQAIQWKAIHTPRNCCVFIERDFPRFPPHLYLLGSIHDVVQHQIIFKETFFSTNCTRKFLIFRHCFNTKCFNN